MPWSSGGTPNSSASVWPRSANVGRVPRSTPGRTRAPGDQQRHVLARMIGRRRRRIVAVVGRDDRAGPSAAAPAAARQSRVEALEVGGIAGDVVAMAVLRVEVHEVDEDQAARRRAELRLDHVHAVVVRRRVDGARQAAAGEQILDLADADDRHGRRPSSRSSSVGAERLEREVAAVRRAREMARLADERPRDDAADAQAAADQLERDLADPVQLVDRNHRLRAPRSGTRCRPTCRRSARPCACARGPARR